MVAEKNGKCCLHDSYMSDAVDGHECFRKQKMSLILARAFLEYAEMDSCHFKWKYKKGREPDVLAYLILNELEQRKFRN